MGLPLGDWSVVHFQQVDHATASGVLECGSFSTGYGTASGPCRDLELMRMFDK